MTRIKLTESVDGNDAGKIIEVRQGYAEALINAGKAVFPQTINRERLISVSTEDGQTVKIVGFPMKQTAGTWAVLANAPNHVSSPAAAATDTIVQTATTVTVDFGITFSSIITAAITEDDILARAGIQVGASVGFDNATLYFAQTGVDLNPNSALMTNGNVFVLVLGIE